MTDQDQNRYPVPIEDLRPILGDDLDRLTEARRQAQSNMLMGRTPDNIIQHREGRAGKLLPYVEHQWVTQQLNLIFGWAWSFEVMREAIGNEQIWVLGKLTTPVGIKTGYGGSEIKRYTKGPKAGQVIDISDDLKAAASEAKKVCAKELGIAADVYWNREKVQAAFKSEEELQEESPF